jgi:hypothetical protein
MLSVIIRTTLGALATFRFSHVQAREAHELGNVEAHGIIDAPRFEFTARDKLIELAEADAQHVGCLLASEQQLADNQNENSHKALSGARFLRPHDDPTDFQAAAKSPRRRNLRKNFSGNPGLSLSAFAEATLFP